MIGKSEVLGYGELYAKEIRRLIAEGSIDAIEAASIVSQTDGLCGLASEVITQQGSHSGLSPFLARLCAGSDIEEMLFSTINPLSTKKARCQRYAMLARFIADTKADFLADSDSMCSQCARAREWRSYTLEVWRRIRVILLFWDLRWMMIKFRWGFRSDVRELTARMRELTAGLPHRERCVA